MIGGTEASCQCHAISVNAKMRVDPTRTTMLRRRYEKELLRRFRIVARDVRQYVKDNITPSNVEGLVGPKTNFDFRRDPDKIDDFDRFIKDRMAAGVLEVVQGQGRKVAAEKNWQNLYLRSAYQKGLSQAAGQMRRGGAEVSDRWIDMAFHRPVHADRAGLIFTRAFGDLEGITQTMEKQLSSILADAMIEGLGSEETARRMSSKMGKISRTRARRLARTETIRAHAEATLNSYEEAGVAGVEVLGEFATAGDNHVCKKCQSLEGRIYKLKEARGLIPVHPNCRCAWLPVLEGLEGVKLL